jgi:hypothetical protein
MMGVAGVLGAALLCAIHGATTEDAEFETFYTKNILLNEGWRVPIFRLTQGMHATR